jgi:hypothetical protein
VAVLTETEINALVKDRCAINVSTDVPVSTAELLRFVNEAYADVYAVAGGGLLAAKHTDAWDDGNMNNGFTTSKLTTIEELLTVFETATDALPDDDDTVLDKTDLAHIQYLRSSSGYGGYGSLKLYSATRIATTTSADINTIRLDVWPTIASKFVGIHYVPQFTPLTAGDEPNVNDLESRDIALLAAMKIAPLVGRAELVPSIAVDVSRRTSLALERKISAMLEGKQDK